MRAWWSRWDSFGSRMLTSLQQLPRYSTAADGEEFDKAKLRLQQIRLALKEIGNEEGTHLELMDMGMGTRTGTTFPINVKMYDARGGTLNISP
jgi:hypothetical protein